MSPLPPKLRTLSTCALDLDLLAWVLDEARDAGLRVRLHVDGAGPGPAGDGLVERLRGAGAVAARVVQRPGCKGLVSSVVVRDADDAALAVLTVDGDPDVEEPLAWRVLLTAAVVGGGAWVGAAVA